MVLITSLCVVELYVFFINFNKGAADIVSYDLDDQNRFALFKTTKILIQF